MSSLAVMERPQRWNQPFGPEMTDEDVQRLMALAPFDVMDASRFLGSTPLDGVLKNDTRLVKMGVGDIVVREGDYGNSAFLLLKGKLRVVLGEGLSSRQLGRHSAKKKNLVTALSQLWTNSLIPERRDTERYDRVSIRGGKGSKSVFLQDIPAILNKHQTAELGEGALFGELAALGRIPRTASVFAEEESELLEIRWQGLREIRKFDPGFKQRIDDLYRQNALKIHLAETELFKGLPPEALEEVANATLFETYGSFDWHVSFKQIAEGKKGDQKQEPLIASQGDYPDGLLMIRAGFARVSVKYGDGDRTLTYLGAGDTFGMHELYDLFNGKDDIKLETSLSALGYIDLLRVPAPILERYVFPYRSPTGERLLEKSRAPIGNDAGNDWLVANRFINATQAMVIDLDKCVRCDDCVRACASTHDGNPRFRRHGKKHDHWMVANACMHCADPVCMIGCPTGAIHRSQYGGMVVINDDTCIGCGTCAASCPYENIVLVEIRDKKGAPVVDPVDQRPIKKATKCDLCATNPGGPACVRACPHDALERVDFDTRNPLQEFLERAR